MIIVTITVLSVVGDGHDQVLDQHVLVQLLLRLYHLLLCSRLTHFLLDHRSIVLVILSRSL